MKEELIKKIVKMEWDMFQKVQNIGGRALCQDDWRTFEIMRVGQFMSWSDAPLQSYLTDLEEGEKSGRNLLSEKYARMMKSTSPLEYAQIEHLLLPLAPEVPPLIEKIVKIFLEWEEEIRQKFPHVTARERPLYSSEDSPFVTSMETYLRGELATYSRRTLELYYNHLLDQKSRNINGAEITLEYIVKQYGYKSIDEANERLKAW